MILRFCTAWLIALTALASLVAASDALSTHDERPELRILVPAYFYPAGKGLESWDKLIEAAHETPIVAIANPASGPGDKPNSDYVELIQRATDGGVTVIGYVTTSYCKRPANEVRAEIDRWFEFYPQIHGIFIDEQPSSKEHAGALIEFSRYVRKKLGSKEDGDQRAKPLVVSNPGTWCAEEFFAADGPDVICIYENRLPFSTIERPAWADAVPAARLAALAHSLEAAAYAQSSADEALVKKIGYLYVTDAKNGTKNPWDRLPSQWQELLNAVRKVGGAVE